MIPVVFLIDLGFEILEFGFKVFCQFKKNDSAKRYNKSLRGAGRCGPYRPEAIIYNPQFQLTLLQAYT
jgi:hypothetical protein